MASAFPGLDSPESSPSRRRATAAATSQVFLLFCTLSNCFPRYSYLGSGSVDTDTLTTDSYLIEPVKISSRPGL